MSSIPKISVVIPCYNAAPFLSEAINSVIDQDWPKIEIIVVDDGSTDGSVDIANGHKGGVRVIRKENAGPGSARNAGIAAAEGEYIAFLDADDLWLPRKLEQQISLIQSTPGARMAYGSWYVWHSNGLRPSGEWLDLMGQQHQSAGHGEGPSGWVYCDLLLDSILNCSTVILHRSLFDEVGAFDTSIPIGEDYDLWLRMSRVTQILRVRPAVAIYRLHAHCTTKAARPVNYQALVLDKALQQWGCEGPDGSIADIAAVKRGLARIWCGYAVGHREAGNWATARDASLRAFSLHPFDAANLRVLARSILRV